MYKISILPEPEIVNGKPMYFWCILFQSGDNHCNCGHGWADGIMQAALDADKYYQDIIKKL